MRALLVGCGSKWGKVFSETLIAQGWTVKIITGSDSDTACEQFKINWQQFDEQQLKTLCHTLDQEPWDLIFFNHVQHGGPGEDSFRPESWNGDFNKWTRSCWINNWMPFLTIKYLKNSCVSQTKVGWMMTGMITDKHDHNIAKYPLYAASKFTNHSIMKAFAANHPATFFSVNPSWFPPGEETEDAEQIIRVIASIQPDQSGMSWNKDGTPW